LEDTDVGNFGFVWVSSWILATASLITCSWCWR